MLSIPKSLEEKYIPLRELISDVVTSRGNWRFLLTNLQVQIWGITAEQFKTSRHRGRFEREVLVVQTDYALNRWVSGPDGCC
jgi:hypothetical protein